MSLTSEVTRQQAFQCFTTGRIPQAVQLGLKALRLNKNDAQVLMMLSLASEMNGQHEAADSYMSRCLTLLPRDPTVLVEAGKLRYARGHFDQAIAFMDEALRLEPGFGPAIGHKAEILERRGDYASARSLLQPLVDQHREDPVMAVIHARVLLEAGETDACLAYVTAQLSGEGVPVQQRRHLHLTAARAYDKLDRVDSAFEAYRLSHEGLNAKFDAADHLSNVDRLIEAFSAENLKAFPRVKTRSPLPVFIASMPRSGSTLAEQVIHAHPNGFGAGEITNLTNIIIDLAKTTDSYAVYPQCVFDLTQKHVDRLGDKYLRDLQAMARGATRIVNKQLDNYFHLGMVQLLWPGARVIHVRRDPVDNCFACFTATLSPMNHPYAGSLADLGLVYRQHERLMRHWHAVLDLPILEVAYEDLVTDPDRWVRAIVDFCGLPWDDRCLRSHEVQRDVMTNSYDQVRKPMYRTSVKRSDRFAAFLGPLRESLARHAAPGSRP